MKISIREALIEKIREVNTPTEKPKLPDKHQKIQEVFDKYPRLGDWIAQGVRELVFVLTGYKPEVRESKRCQFKVYVQSEEINIQEHKIYILLAHDYGLKFVPSLKGYVTFEQKDTPANKEQVEVMIKRLSAMSDADFTQYISARLGHEHLNSVIIGVLQ